MEITIPGVSTYIICTYAILNECKIYTAVTKVIFHMQVSRLVRLQNGIVLQTASVVIALSLHVAQLYKVILQAMECIQSLTAQSAKGTLISTAASPSGQTAIWWTRYSTGDAVVHIWRLSFSNCTILSLSSYNVIATM